jgi:hypothetical protein
MSAAAGVSAVQQFYDIAGVPVTARLQEQYRYEAMVTQYAVESPNGGGTSYYADHVILQPIRVDIEAETGNLVRGDAQNSLNCLKLCGKIVSR